MCESILQYMQEHHKVSSLLWDFNELKYRTSDFQAILCTCENMLLLSTQETEQSDAYFYLFSNVTFFMVLSNSLAGGRFFARRLTFKTPYNYEEVNPCTTYFRSMPSLSLSLNFKANSCPKRDLTLSGLFHLFTAIIAKYSECKPVIGCNFLLFSFQQT